MNNLSSGISGPQDLPHYRVATLPNTTSETYLREEGVPARLYKTANEAMEAVARGDVDAFVYDTPIMKYIAYHDMKGNVMVLPFVFQRQDYGIALPTRSPLREMIDIALLDKITQRSWKEIQRKYLGE